MKRKRQVDQEAEVGCHPAAGAGPQWASPGASAGSMAQSTAWLWASGLQSQGNQCLSFWAHTLPVTGIVYPITLYSLWIQSLLTRYARLWAWIWGCLSPPQQESTVQGGWLRSEAAFQQDEWDRWERRPFGFQVITNTSWPPLGLRTDPGPMYVRGLELYPCSISRCWKRNSVWAERKGAGYSEKSAPLPGHTSILWKVDVKFLINISTPLYFYDKECVGDASEDEGFSVVPTQQRKKWGQRQGWHGLSLLVSLKLGLEESRFLLQSPLCSRGQENGVLWEHLCSKRPTCSKPRS